MPPPIPGPLPLQSHSRPKRKDSHAYNPPLTPLQVNRVYDAVRDKAQDLVGLANGSASPDRRRELLTLADEYAQIARILRGQAPR